MDKDSPERSEEAGEAESAAGSSRVLVEDSHGQRPFMRGIMVHALMARGVEFDAALRTLLRTYVGRAGRPSWPM